MFGRRARKKAEQEALRRMMEEAEANRRAAMEAEYEAEQEERYYYESEIIFDDELEDSYYDYQYEMQDIDEDLQTPDNFVVALPIHEDKPEEIQTATQETVEEEHKEEPVQETLPEEHTAQEPIQDTVPEEAVEEPVQEVAQEPVQETVPEPIQDVQEPVQIIEEEQKQEVVQEVIQEEVQEPVQDTAQEPVENMDTTKPIQDVEQELVYDEHIDETAEQGGDGEPIIHYIVDGPTEDDELVKPAKLVKLPNLIDYMLSLKTSKRMKINIATLLLGAYQKFKDIPEEKEIVIGCMKKVMFALMNA